MRRGGARRPGQPGDRRPPGAADLVVGRRAVQEALAALADAGAGEPASSPALERVLVATGSALARGALPALARQARVPLVRVPRETLDRLAGGSAHQGVVAQVAVRRALDLAELLDAIDPPALLVLLDGLVDPRNLGAVLRSAAAAGASGVVLPERRSAPLSPTAAKASAGAIDRIPVARAKSVQRALVALAEAGIWTVGLAAGARSLWEGPDLTRPTCFVVGGEERGLSRLARERCDDLASLPLERGVQSLNAAVAAGVALYEAVRQRRARPSG